MAEDIGWLMSSDSFGSLVQEHLRYIGASEKAQSSVRIDVPGEIEYERECLSRKQGV